MSCVTVWHRSLADDLEHHHEFVLLLLDDCVVVEVVALVVGFLGSLHR